MRGTGSDAATGAEESAFASAGAYGALPWCNGVTVAHDTLADDPLSPQGALRLYRSRRNRIVRTASRWLAAACAEEIGWRGARRSGGMSPGLDDADSLGAPGAANPANPANAAEVPLRFSQAAILDNGYSEMTSLLIFHPFEPALVVADERDGVSVWNFETGERRTRFRNSNSSTSASPAGSAAAGANADGSGADGATDGGAIRARRARARGSSRR